MSLTFLASCQTTQDPYDWLEANGYEVHNRPEVVHVHKPRDQAKYVPEVNRVELSHRYEGTMPEKAMLVHELVHAQQDTTDHEDVDVCLKLETEAYSVMQAYMEDHGSKLPGFFAEYGASQSCEPVEWAKRYRMVQACKKAGQELCDPREWQ